MIFGAGFPTLKRGANERCAYGAGVRDPGIASRAVFGLGFPGAQVRSTRGQPVSLSSRDRALRPDLFCAEVQGPEGPCSLRVAAMRRLGGVGFVVSPGARVLGTGGTQRL